MQQSEAFTICLLGKGRRKRGSATDWPFENIDHAANWFDACAIGENDRLKIGRTNARRLFKLGNE